MSWRIIYVAEGEKLSLHLDNVKITKGDKEVTVPLSDINTIMVDNLRMLLSTHIINKCADYNISLITCDHKHTPRAIVMPISGNYRSSLMLREQLRWTQERAGIVWRHIIRLKIMQQTRVLTLRHAPQEVIERMQTFARDVAPADPSNCEGLAAKMYFRALFGADFLRDDETVINAALNYGYSIVRSQLARAIVAHGLNAHIGIFHRGPNNAFNLADDLIEPLRPIIDYWVIEHIDPEEMFVRKHRIELIALMTRKVDYNNKKVTLIFAINNLVENFITVMNDSNEPLTRFIYPDIKIYDL